MNIFDFATKQLDLIEIEKNAEIDESKTLLNTLSLQRLQLKGLCLLKLKIDHKHTGLYGRTIIVLQSAVPGKVINTQYFSSGDIVSISENSVPPSQLNNEKNLISGTVTKVAPQSISIAIDKEIENLDEQLNENDVYKIIKLCNDITHKRIKTALLNLKDLKLNDRTSRLADVLFLNAKPDRCNINNVKFGSELAYQNQQFELEFFNNRLDKSQKEAVQFTFEQKELAIIHGPPGTGKTTTLIEIIKQNCLKYKQKILCVAPSNIAVDNLVERLIPAEKGYSRIQMIRLGHPARLLEHIHEYSLDSVVNKSDQFKLANDIKSDMDKALKTIRKSSTQRGEREGLKREMRELRKELYKREERALKEVLQKADIILATMTTTHDSGSLKHLKDDHFDIIIIDECSQAMEAACWIPIVKGARKLIIAGDHLQLPPTIISKEASDKGLDLTLMKRLIDALGDESSRMLTIQYRMNKLINNWISEKLYESKLEAHETVAEHLLCDMDGVVRNETTSNALVLIDTDGCEMSEMIMSDENAIGDEESKANDGEANIVCRHVDDLIKSGVKQEQIAVITPYNLQMELIRAKLHTKYPQVEVKSVDSFQGREKEAVILSLVRSNSRGEVGFLADQRRINVAITRARRHLCVVCDSQTCKNNEFLKSFLDYCEKYADIRSGFDYENSGTDDTNLDLGFEDIKFQKLKIAEPKKSENKSKEKSDNKARNRKAKKNEPVQIETEEDKQFEAQTIKIIERLAELNVYTFSDELTSRQRRIVHELGEKYNIYHSSKTVNDKRKITISKNPIKEEKEDEETVTPKPEVVVKPENVDLKIEDEPPIPANELINVDQNKKFEILEDEIVGVASESKNKKKKKKNNEKTEVSVALAEQEVVVEKKTADKKANSLLLGEISDQNDSDLKYRNDCKLCPQCDKYILKVNYMMHELHCTKVKKQAEAAAAAKVEANSKGAPKAEKIKKNTLAAIDKDDFDELINAMQNSNNVCNFVGCKVLVKTLGQNCEFCRNRFCLNHSLAEVHGCGDEAKAQARAHIRKTGNLDVNVKKTSYSAEIKHKYTEKKFHEKLDAMKAARTGADKKKDKK